MDCDTLTELIMPDGLQVMVNLHFGLAIICQKLPYLRSDGNRRWHIYGM